MHRSPQLLGALDIAGLPCRLECDDPSFADVLAQRYASFLTARPHDFSVRIDVRRAVDAGVAADAGMAADGPYARVGADGGTITVNGAGFHGFFDERRARGHIVQPAEPAPLETLLTAIYAARLLREGGCLLHAAAIVRDGAAYVFFGPSGSGKTTVSELVGEGVITDEIAVLRRDGRGWRVSGVPWRGSARAAPLGALLHLRQWTSTHFVPLAPADAVRRLLACAFFARVDGAEIDAFLGTATAMLARVPAWELRFARTCEFWTALPRGTAA